ncbi:unnamed protein product [Parajaminaea phylloscopi]
MADTEHAATSPSLAQMGMGNGAGADVASGNQSNGVAASPHPFLTQPLLYISGLDPHLEDRDLATSVFAALLPVRLNIDRKPGQTASGTVEFQTLDKAEKALATIRTIKLHLSPPGKADPEPEGKPLLIKQLPVGTNDFSLYDLCRPFGPIHRAECIHTNPQGQVTGFRGMATVVYYREQDSRHAQDELNCLDVQGKLISVRLDPDPRRPPQPQGISAQAAPFVPGAKLSAQAPAFAPVAPTTGTYAYTPLPEQMDTSRGPIWAVPGTNLQYSSSASTYIDPCNLFCKNLCPSIDSSDLYQIFKPYGRIVSARVMREGGKSREFGFVSFTNAEDAARALHAVDGQHIGSKSVIVRLHEPKSLRQEKLSKIFAGKASAGAPRSPVSPTNGAHGQHPSANEYFTGPNETTGAFDEVQLAGMESDERNDVILGEFIKRAQAMPELGDDDDKVKEVVLGLSQLNLAEQVQGLNNAREFARLVQRVRREDASPQTVTQPLHSTQAPQDVAAPKKSASHLSVPLSDRTNAGAEAVSITSTAGPASGKERNRLLQAVTQLMPAGSPVEDVTDLLAGLPKKERAMALFNPEYLRAKVSDAKEALDIAEGEGEDDGDEVAAADPRSVKAVKDAPVVQSQTTAPAAAAAEADASHTLSSLAQLSCEEILKLADKAKTDKSSPGLPLPKVDEARWKETDAMMDRILEEKREAERKQKLGEVLFKRIKAFGIKGVPKVTIRLLDGEDLRSLAHVMDSYPDLLREKVAVIQAAAEKAK